MRVHIIQRDDVYARPNFAAMAAADWIYLIEPDGTAKCIKGPDPENEPEPTVTYEHIAKPSMAKAMARGDAA